MPDPLNPHFDEAGVFFDAGFFFADGVPDSPTLQNRKRMASLRLNLSRLNAAQLVALADLVSPKLAPAAPGTPPIPNLSAKVTSLLAKRDLAETADDEYESAKAGLKNLKETRDQAADDLRLEHTSLGKAVESEAKGDAVLLTSSGYPLAADSVQSTEPPAKVQNVALTAGDSDGALDYSYDPTARAVSYEVQLTSVSPIDGPWSTKAQPTASSGTISELTSATRVWIRVRGIGAQGAGAWSDPATKIVP